MRSLRARPDVSAEKRSSLKSTIRNSRMYLLFKCDGMLVDLLPYQETIP